MRRYSWENRANASISMSVENLLDINSFLKNYSQDLKITLSINDT